MPTRTYDQNELLFGSQNGLCDECGFKFKQVDLREKWNGLVLCRDCWEPKHISQLYKYTAHDNSGGVGSNTRSTDNMDQTGTSIDGTPIPPNPITITTLSLDPVYATQPYSLQIETDIAPYPPAVWSITSGALPDGLTLDSETGIVSGTPTTDQEAYTVTIKVLDSVNRTDTQDYSGTTEIIYSAPCTWEAVDNQPADSTAPAYGPRMHGMTAMPNGKYIHVGSSSTKVSADPTDELESWDSVTAYTTTGFKNDVQNWLVDIMDDGTVCVIDGVDFWTYDYNTDAWTQQSSIPTANAQQDRATGVAIRDGLYDFVSYGGQKSISPFYFFNEVWAYTKATDTWTQLNDYAEAEFNWGTAVYLGDNKVFVGGGAFRSGMPDSSIIYNYYIHDLTTDLYSAVTPIPAAYHRPDPVVQYLTYDNQVVLAGQGTNSAIPSDDVYVYDIDTDTWGLGCDVLPTAVAVADGWGAYIMTDYRVGLVRGTTTVSNKAFGQTG
jgi:hypothetical protein